MSLCRYVLCCILLTQCRIFAVDMEQHVQSAYVCGLNVTNLHCGYAKIAIKSLEKRFKDNIKCQKFPSVWTGCCKNTVSDCTVFDTETRLNHRECSGEYKCTSFGVPESSEGTACHKMEGLSDYSVLNYYCVPDSRSFEMCTKVRAAALNQSIYIKSMNYPKSSYEVSCSCSIEVDSCTPGITMYTIDAQLPLTNNCSCLSNVTVKDESNKIINLMQCEPPVYNTITTKLFDERYIVIEAMNPYNLTNMSTNGMYFWFGFKAHHQNTAIELNCPPKERRLCNDCGKPKSIRNGDLIYSSTSGGSIATVACYIGHTSNVGKIKCTRFGKWENTSCNLKDCGNPKPIANGYIFLDEARISTYGAYATVLCDIGYSSRAQVVSCLETGKWGSASCKIKDCGRQMSIVKGNIALQVADTSTYGAKADVVCEKGYSSTTKVVTCQKDGSWSSASCLIKDCGKPPNISHGTVDVIDGSATTHTSEARVTCDFGYTSDTSIVTCRETGKWETSSCDDFSAWVIIVASVVIAVIVVAVGISLGVKGRRYILKRTYDFSKARLQNDQ